MISVWLSVDPKADAFPSVTPYSAFMNNPIMMVDPGGDSVIAVFNRDQNTLYMVDFDHYQEGLPTAYVSADDYELDGVYDQEGNLAVNQVLVVPGVFTGGNSQSGEITYGNDEFELPIPTGDYELLEYTSASIGHDGWFRVDPYDSSPRNDRYDNSMHRNSDGDLRTAFRLHPGSMSFGCVTFNSRDQRSVDGFNMVSQILNNTSTNQVRDRLGILNGLGVRTQMITKYGNLIVR